MLVPPTPRGGVASPHSATEGCRWSSARSHIRIACRRARVLIADACSGCSVHRGSSREFPHPTPHVFSQLGARRVHTLRGLPGLYPQPRAPAFLSRLLRRSTAFAFGSRLCIPVAATASPPSTLAVAYLRLSACSIPYPLTDPRPIFSHEVLSLPHVQGCFAATSS